MDTGGTQPEEVPLPLPSPVRGRPRR
jgi:hypothetical protein